MDKKVMRYESRIKVDPASLNKVNNQFALVDILLCYEGRNRNKTSISKKVIEDNLSSLYGCPIIGEWIVKDDGSKDFGTHGGKIVIDDNGIRYEQTTHAYGFITKDAVENAKWVTITEKDGHTKHDYLELKGCFIWQKRFEEVSILLDENRPQSMEINIEKAHYDEENYLVIDNLTFGAACILGSGVAPCFESASIGRHYELDSVKSDLDTMMKEYRSYKENYSNKEAKQMDISEIKGKLSEFTYKNELGEDCEKYSLVSVTEDIVGVFDREDYKMYSFKYAVTEADGLVIDFDNKTPGSCIVAALVSDSDGVDFSMAGEVEAVKSVFEKKFADEKSKAVDMAAKAFAEEYDAKYNEMCEAYKALKIEYDSINAEYTRLHEADESHKQEIHKAEVDAVLDEYAAKIRHNAEFMLYRAKIDYSKSVEDVRKELTIIAGKAMMNDGKGARSSYTPSEAAFSFTNASESAAESRYGNLFDKFKK